DSEIAITPKQEQPSSNNDENMDRAADDIIDQEITQTNKDNIEKIAVDKVSSENRDLPTFVSLTEEFKRHRIAACKSNDPLSRYILACKYRDGIGTEKNATQARIWFNRVKNKTAGIKAKANLNHARSQYVYGLMLRDGFADIKKNIVEAKDYLLSAADLGDRDAQYEIARLLDDTESSKFYLELAIIQGNTLAIFKSLENYWYKPDDDLLQLAIALGYTRQQFLSSTSNEPYRYKYDTAEKESETKTFTELISQVMKPYKKNHDTKSLTQLPKEAVTISLPKLKTNDFFSDDFLLTDEKIKLVSTGSKTSTPKLSSSPQTNSLELDSVKEISEEDIGKYLDDKAIKKYHLAAKQGIASAQYSLGMIYEFGLGVTKDINIAARWYHKAEKQHHDKAQHRLEKLFDKAKIEEYRIAVEHGNANSKKMRNILSA
ncbi:MAG: tetratricopeptide repeat protein, partial [Gammaproteobacteria bacterium]